MYNIEITDTFGGEANYCWVKHGKTNRNSRKGIIAAVKELAGWNGWCRIRVIHWTNDFIEIRPTLSSGVNQVAFIHWED